MANNAKYIVGTTGGQINFSEVTSPDVPPAGYVALYAQNRDIYTIDSSGTIEVYGSSGTSGVSGSSGTSGRDGAGGATGYYGAFLTLQIRLSL